MCFERKDYTKAISSVLTADHFKEVMSFANDEDRQLIRQMDKFIRSTENKIVDLSKLKVSDLNFNKFELKNERLRRLPRKVLEMRAELFLKFTKQFLAASSTLSFSGKISKDSLTHFLMANKNLALDSVKDAIFDNLVTELIHGPVYN